MADIGHNWGAVRVADGTCDANILNVSASGKVDVNWDDCPINEDSIRAISKEEARKALQVKTKQLTEDLDKDSPIRILRRKVQKWLKD